MNDIVPGIQSTAPILIWNGVRVTSDLDAQWNSTIQSLPEMDYSGIGGSPIAQYANGLTQIHFESFEIQTGHGRNLTNHRGLLDDRYYLGPSIQSPLSDFGANAGIDTIYVDTTNWLGRDHSRELMAGVMIHEMLHESRFVDAQALVLVDQLRSSIPNFSDLSPRFLPVLRSAAEHIIIAQFMEALGETNPLGGYFAQAPSLGKYMNELRAVLDKGNLDPNDYRDVLNGIADTALICPTVSHPFFPMSAAGLALILTKTIRL